MTPTHVRHRRAQVRPHVSVFTLNKPERLELDVVPARPGALRRARRGRPTTTKAGSSCSPAPGAAFCSGLDLHDRGVPPNIKDLGFSRLAMRSMSYMGGVVPALRALPQPVISAINGAAIGGGMCLTLGADIRYASESAVLLRTRGSPTG